MSVIPTIDDCFYGTATIGERGQIVIPADARKECGFHPGDKLLVFRHPIQPNVLLFARVKDIQQIQQQLARAMGQLVERLNETDNDTDSEISEK